MTSLTQCQPQRRTSSYQPLHIKVTCRALLFHGDSRSCCWRSHVAHSCFMGTNAVGGHMSRTPVSWGQQIMLLAVTCRALLFHGDSRSCCWRSHVAHSCFMGTADHAVGGHMQCSCKLSNRSQSFYVSGYSPGHLKLKLGLLKTTHTHTHHSSIWGKTNSLSKGFFRNNRSCDNKNL